MSRRWRTDDRCSNDDRLVSFSIEKNDVLHQPINMGIGKKSESLFMQINIAQDTSIYDFVFCISSIVRHRLNSLTFFFVCLQLFQSKYWFWAYFNAILLTCRGTRNLLFFLFALISLLFFQSKSHQVCLMMKLLSHSFNGAALFLGEISFIHDFWFSSAFGCFDRWHHGEIRTIIVDDALRQNSLLRNDAKNSLIGCYYDPAKSLSHGLHGKMD